MTRAKGHRYQHIAARVFDTPLLIHENKLRAILRVLGPRMDFDLEAPRAPQGMADDDGPYAPPDPFLHMEYLQALGVKLEPMAEGYFRGEGVAILPVSGTLVQRSDWMTDTSGMQSYGRLERMMNAALDDPSVHELLWEFDTPGGEVAGAFDFADRIYDARGRKPMTASINEFAASAGYLLASAVGNIAVSRTSGVGSIGVVAAHFDYSEAIEKRGVAVTYIYAGDRKIDGNPYQPLSEQAKKDWQAEVDDTYALFIDTVARNTGLSAGKIRSTQAALYTGQKAIDAGLAQRLNTFSNEFGNATLRAKERKANPYSRMNAEEARPKLAALGVREKTIEHWFPTSSLAPEKEIEMSNTPTPTPAAPATTVAAAPAAPATPAPAAPAAEAPSAEAILTAERARVSGIKALPEAQGRGKLADTLCAQGLSVDQAKAILASAPKENALATAMAGRGPGIRSEDQPESQEQPTISYKEAYANFNDQMRGGKKAA
jgi:signal peptide peptidase SppA